MKFEEMIECHTEFYDSCDDVCKASTCIFHPDYDKKKSMKQNTSKKQP